MLNLEAQWRPGSFTKNFSWGQPADGLERLHEAIQVGFDGKIENVLRSDFRNRVSNLNRPDFIPLNFFLLNEVIDGQSFVIIDELVYAALTKPHDHDFDALAPFSFNASYVGRWLGAEPWQQYPAAWAFFYITERLASQGHWDTASVNADDIEDFIAGDKRYTGQTSRKLATNLAYIYRVGGLTRLSTDKITRLWADIVFLALDRLSAEAGGVKVVPSADALLNLLNRSRFSRLSGLDSLGRELALEPLCMLYEACGGIARWSVERVHERQHILIPHINQYLGSNEPTFFVDPRDATVMKAVPEACAMLARYVGHFEPIDDPSTFDVESYVRARTHDAMASLRALNVSPTISAEDLLRLTRG